MDLTLIAPGSPDPRHAQDLRLLAARLEATGHRAGVAFLDHCRPRPVDAAAQLAVDRRRTTVAVPMVSAAGFRMRADITAALRAMAAGHPQLHLTAAPAIGVHPLLLDCAAQLLSGLALGRHTGIILATAGFRDARTLAALDSLVREQGARLCQMVGARAVRTSHLDGGRPLGRTRTLLRHLDGCREAVAVPMVMTQGLLGDRIARAAVHADIALAGGSLAATNALVELVLLRASVAVPLAGPTPTGVRATALA